MGLSNCKLVKVHLAGIEAIFEFGSISESLFGPNIPAEIFAAKFSRIVISFGGSPMIRIDICSSSTSEIFLATARQ